MKTAHALFAITVLAFTSCYHAQDEVLLEDESQVSFRLTFEGISQEQLTRGASTPSLGTPAYLLVLDKYNGSTQATQKNTVGDVALPLQFGTHDLYFVAAPVSWTSYSAANLTVTWPNDGQMKAVWAYHYQIAVDASTVFEDITLPLAVADVRIATLDKVPSSAVVATIEAPGVSSTLNLSTMQAVVTSSSGYYREFAVTGLNSAFAANIYSFVPADEKVGDIAVAFYSNAEKSAEIASHTIESVPVKQGYVSNYSGYFFSDGLTIPLSCTSDWLGSSDYTY